MDKYLNKLKKDLDATENRTGGILFLSMNIFTGTTGPVWPPAINRAGPIWWHN